jgi:hypothetical protein
MTSTTRHQLWHATGITAALGILLTVSRGWPWGIGLVVLAAVAVTVLVVSALRRAGTVVDRILDSSEFARPRSAPVDQDEPDANLAALGSTETPRTR